MRKCQVANCEKPNKGTGKMCSMHSARLRRTGTTERVKRGEGRYVDQAGYVYVQRPEHPLARKKDGFVREHRANLYDKENGGAICCHWCGQSLTWTTCRTDHLNEVKNDNRKENLVPSCNVCNLLRGSKRSRDTRVKKFGARITANGKTRLLVEWAEDLGISTATIRQRIKIGWPESKAVSVPARSYRKGSG